MSEFEDITTSEAVHRYESTRELFDALLGEIRELSKKRSAVELSESQVTIINRVLRDLIELLKREPQGKFLEELDSDSRPLASDALLMMVQFEAALNAFKARYDTAFGWLTPELVAELEAEGLLDDEDDDEDEDNDEGDDEEGQENEDDRDHAAAIEETKGSRPPSAEDKFDEFRRLTRQRFAKWHRY